LLSNWNEEKEQAIRSGSKNEPEIQCDRNISWEEYKSLKQRRDIAVQFTSNHMEWEPSQAEGG